MNLPTKNSTTMKLPKIIAILAGTIVGTEIVMFLVHQLLMGYPYNLNFLSIPAFFAAFEALFCIMGYKSLMHSKNTRFFMAFKTIKMLGAVIFVAAYVMMVKTEGANSGLLIRFFVEYLALMAAETYIGARVTVTISENGTLSHKEPMNTDKTEK